MKVRLTLYLDIEDRNTELELTKLENCADNLINHTEFPEIKEVYGVRAQIEEWWW